ncbi:GntR family transcriptional regulator [Paenibacillus sp. UNC496MF]|uniref:GntR family transcriptional regulator n=1 Tax=Paenibacillus sp. UNC496MF TaxID=1502753 RepID=UPI0008F2FAB3|nr:GntR family transcriptional regulator [Paenibacillus sp. UNC496MF]SFJ40564.1 GntR family transcriptional regulator [Paenibacillus sp. UNC496MF]
MVNRYAEICAILGKEIDQGLFMEGERLPTERELSDRFGVSRETIRRSLKQLIELGRVHGIQGSGYYVRRQGQHMKSTINRFSSITELIRNANLTEGDLEVQIFKRKPDAQEIQLLDLGSQDVVFVIDRIRTADREPVVYSKNILPQRIVGVDFPEKFEPGSLTKCLSQKYGITVAEALMELCAVTDEDMLPYRLKVSNSPLLKFIQVHYDAKGAPIFLSYDFMRNDKIRFFVRRT